MPEHLQLAERMCENHIRQIIFIYFIFLNSSNNDLIDTLKR